MLNFHSERSYRKMLEEEITQLQQEVNRLKDDKKVSKSYFFY
jgi:flagellin-like hook-associated protein FlgL